MESELAILELENRVLWLLLSWPTHMSKPLSYQIQMQAYSLEGILIHEHTVLERTNQKSKFPSKKIIAPSKRISWQGLKICRTFLPCLVWKEVSDHDKQMLFYNDCSDLGSPVAFWQVDGKRAVLWFHNFINFGACWCPIQTALLESELLIQPWIGKW